MLTDTPPDSHFAPLPDSVSLTSGFLAAEIECSSQAAAKRVLGVC